MGAQTFHVVTVSTHIYEAHITRSDPKGRLLLFVLPSSIQEYAIGIGFHYTAC